MKKIAEILIEKLTPDELTLLCDSWEEGGLDDVFYEVLLPMDIVKYKEILDKRKGLT